MAKEEEIDLKEEEQTPPEGKEGEDKTPSGDDQPDKTTKEALEGDEMVEVSKSELERLKKDSIEKDNYKGAVIRLNKNRGHILPESEPKKKKLDDDDFGDEPEKDYVTREELTARDEKAAIREASKTEEIALNWDDIISFYVAPEAVTYEAKLFAINKAHKLWRADKGITDKPKVDNSAKEAKSKLANESGVNKGKDKPATTEKKGGIIPKKSSMGDWYK